MEIWDKPVPFEKVYLHPGHHVGYFPGASPISLKLIFSRKDGRVVGAQAIGREGVEKRIDVISMAIQKKATVFDLEKAELCYAPQFGSAKDPVNIAGMIAANVLKGDALGKNPAFILDVRNPSEYQQDHIEDAVNIPLDELRNRMGEVPKDQEIWVYCAVGQRSYYASRALSQYGYDINNLSGGFKTFTLKEALEFI